METSLERVSARSAVINICDGGKYNTLSPYGMVLNGKAAGETDRCVTYLPGLSPDTAYVLDIMNGEEKLSSVSFHTKREFVTLDVRDFGAKGDGEHDDTSFIQAAIMACPAESRVLVPAGTYMTGPLFMKSKVTLYLDKGAVIKAYTDPSHFPYFQGMVQSYDEKEEYNLATWEGNPLSTYASVITGIDCSDIAIEGEGVIDGSAGKDNWWKDVKKHTAPYRPRLVFLNRCKNVTLAGITLTNSPSWTLHPYFTDNIAVYGLTLKNPFDSPNTDGIDPESCKGVTIAGVRFSLGDDCIAVKSGKLYMGRKYAVPCSGLTVRNCLMEDGHGAVTVGSEMAGGVKDMTVKDCVFNRTDRGLRVKTRRGRGKNAVIDNVVFSDIDMESVLTPFVVNSYYFCDPDGHAEAVQTREPAPVGDGTPSIGDLAFRNITAKNTATAAAYIEGLTEKKIKSVTFENVSIEYDPGSEGSVPAMTEGVGKCIRKGFMIRNVEKLVLSGVKAGGYDGEVLDTERVDSVEGTVETI
ncbi:MAG: glycoside hydrolase family 28 protein [Lachnospiraceae bacterium]|nr:glycoside hydrolase family 28 protein [Lachnospiraceae bacterium]